MIRSWDPLKADLSSPAEAGHYEWHEKRSLLEQRLLVEPRSLVSWTSTSCRQRLRPERGAKSPRESERGWGPASIDRRGTACPVK